MTDKLTSLPHKNDAAREQRAVLVPLLSARAFKLLFVALFALLAAIVLCAPDRPPPNDSPWRTAYELAIQIPDVRTSAARTPFPVAAALGYAFALTVSIPLAVIALFVRMYLSHLEALLRKQSVRYRFLIVAFLLAVITIPFYVENLETSLLTEQFEARIMQHRAISLVYFGGLLGVLTLAWFWILFESIALIRGFRAATASRAHT